MTTIQPILEKLENTNSQNEKIKILETLSPAQKEWFRICYNPLITFGIKKIPDVSGLEVPTPKVLDFQDVMNMYLKYFASRELTGNSAITKLQEILLQAHEPEAAKRLIQRDAKCGVNVSLLNKVFPNLIPEIPCMLAQPMNEKTLKNIKFPAFSQLKADGMRCIVFISTNKVEMYSRNGTQIFCEPLKKNLEKISFFPDILISQESIILDGEMICYKDNSPLDRKTSNGICNKVLKQTASQEELELVHLQLWDCVFVNSETLIPLKDKPYSDRLNELYDILGFSNFTKLEVIPTETVETMEQAMEHFQSMLSQGLEGTILKNIDSKWENKRSKNLVKLKEENTIDLLVVAVEEGDGDFKGGIGSLLCKTRDNKLCVSVGTGLSLEDRGFTNDLSNGKKVVKQIKSFDDCTKNYLGKIVEVKYNQLIKAKNKEEYSLFLPRLVRVRLDKDQANSVDEI